MVTVMPNNALERTVEHRGPRLPAAQRWWPTAQTRSLAGNR
jgi:hypothetical protein